MAQITLKSKPVHTNGELPNVGSKAPDFELVDQNLNDKSLKSFSAKKKLISIVPSLDTEVCGISTKKFNEYAQKHPDIVILVVSADLPFAQKRFCGQENVQNVHTLSMMRSNDFAKDYGVLIMDGPLKGVCARAIVVVDEKDDVLYAELVSEIANEPDYEKALRHL